MKANQTFRTKNTTGVYILQKDVPEQPYKERKQITKILKLKCFQQLASTISGRSANLQCAVLGQLIIQIHDWPQQTLLLKSQLLLQHAAQFSLLRTAT